MQTFLPYPSFHETAKILDYQRLGKQRVEAWQILQALQGNSRGWVNHPATRMWRSFEYALALYGLVMCDEWIKRGYNDTMRDRFLKYVSKDDTVFPWWIGDKQFHDSHKSNLVRKNSEYYRVYFPDIPIDLEYHWPV